MKKIAILLCTLLTALSVLTGISVSAATPSSNSFSVAAKSAIAVDASSGKILYAQNADDSSTAIASITKLLTAYLVYKDIAEGKLSWTTKVPISQYAYDLTQNSNASNIPLAKDETYTVKDLMNALLIPSANSAAVALAEKVAGSEPKFVDMMTAQMKAWGINDTHLVNASGLPNDDLNGHIYPGSSNTATNTMSAKAVAVLSYHLIKDYPQVLDITKQVQLPFDTGGKTQTTLTNTNQMLKGFTNSRAGVDGLKTGSTSFQIDCFAGTTTQNGFRIITVVLDADNPAVDNSTPFTLTNQLMNYVYGHWCTASLTQKRKAIKDFDKISLTDGKQKSVNLVAGETINPVVPFATDGSADLKSLSIKYSQKKTKTIEAPVTKGQKIVTVSASLKDKLGYLPGSSTAQFSLVAKNDVEKSNPLKVFWNHFVIFVNEKL
ncbi:serine hydrolase [Lactococcus protaetiae]|uniref:serine-type D-Ala-D-Ala carboxypeptidase n=1 Tax=Lactococcus protaetiae TaxID=2592653 RepID=A0A514Z6L8_9LACT|nr:serine hydrolase [Lactococcus protaetiae]QDK70238.1 D-alanyl-D-alanine carboxypeptidase [Lactococcus protaetiae]